MSKRGKSKRSHRCAVFLSVVLCAGLFTGCGDKKVGKLGDVVSFWIPVDGYPDYLAPISPIMVSIRSLG